MTPAVLWSISPRSKLRFIDRALVLAVRSALSQPCCGRPIGRLPELRLHIAFTKHPFGADRSRADLAHSKDFNRRQSHCFQSRICLVLALILNPGVRMKILLAAILLIPFNAQATFSERGDRVFRTCVTGPVVSGNQVRTYELQLIGNTKGVHSMLVYASSGPSRIELQKMTIYHSSPTPNVTAWVDVKSRETVLVYRERAAPTREGFVRIEDGGQIIQTGATCY